MQLSKIVIALSWIRNRWIQLRVFNEPEAKQEFDAVCASHDFFTYLHVLRDEEGDSVEFVSDNADFNGQPNCQIICCGWWTGWEDKRFAADTVLECLRAAHEAKVQWVMEKPAGSIPSPKPETVPLPVADYLNKLPEVSWDRCTGDEENMSVFGWVARDDGRADYVMVMIDKDGPWLVSTSSAIYSEEFSLRLLGGNGVGHKPCRRVEHEFPTVRCIRMEESNIKPPMVRA